MSLEKDIKSSESTIQAAEAMSVARAAPLTPIAGNDAQLPNR